MPDQVAALILLPTFFNLDDPDDPGLTIPDSLFQLTGEELSERFGGATLHLHREAPPRGFWWDRGILYEDVLAVVELDIPDTDAAREDLREYIRSMLLRRFRQKAIYVRFIRIEGIAVTDDVVAPALPDRRTS